MQETMPAVAGQGGVPVAAAPQEGCALAAHIEAALAGPMTLDTLDEIARAIWGALGAGQLSEAEAARLDGLARVRRAQIGATARGAGGGMHAAARLVRPPRVRRPRSPDRLASIERRRRVAASGAVPPEIAARFTQGEVAVLSVVGREATRGRPSCDWPMDRIAALAGVSRTVARGALRLAQMLGLLRVQERRRRAARSDTNVVTITGRDWRCWLRRAGRKAAGRTVGEGAGTAARRTAGAATTGETAKVAARSTRSAAPAGGGCGKSKATCTEELGRVDAAPAHPEGCAIPRAARGRGRNGPCEGVPMSG